MMIFPVVTTGRFFHLMVNIMKHSKLIINLIYYATLNKWRNKNKIYVIFTSVISAYFLFQLLSTNGALVYLLKETPVSDLPGILANFFDIVFILWIVSPLFFGVKLSSMNGFSEFQYLPIRNYHYILVNNILGLIGIGPLITLLIVYTILFHRFDTNVISFIIISLPLLMFINISGTTSALINNYKLYGRATKSRFMQVAQWLIPVFLLVGIIYFKQNRIISHLYLLLPSSLLMSGIRELMGNNSTQSVLPFLGLGSYYVFLNFLYSCILLSRRKSPLKNKVQKIKHSFFPSLFNFLSNLLKGIIWNSKMRMLVTKEIIYFAKNTRLILWNLMQIAAAFVFFGELSNDLSDLFSSTALMAGILGVFNLSLYMNIFAFDSNGFQNYYIYPISFKMVYLSKNFANFIISLNLLVVITLMALIVSDLYFTWLQIIALTCLFLYSSILSQSFGNIFSIYFAINIPYDRSMGLFNPYSSILISIIVVFMAMIPSVLLTLVSIGDSYRLGISISFCFMSIYIYKICLNYVSRKIYEKRMIVLNEIV